MSRITDIIESLKTDRDFRDCVTRWEVIPPRSGQYAPIPDEVDPRVTEALSKRGVKQLYIHQQKAYNSVRAGRNTVVVTPTASGKTLCYNLPVLQTLLEHEEARALYLFPTKALSQDQQSELNESVLMGELPVKICTYDGDTPASLRVSAREKGQIVISNPDMLHAGILPNHPKWIKFLRNLKYIVIDEVHIYRGVMGSHVTNLIRRLKRTAMFYGSNPVFICCSATIGNPKELAEQIIEEPAVLIDENGSPSGEKHIVLYNPPLVDHVQGIRRGVVLEAKKIAIRLLKESVKTIVFARSRIRTELIATYINQGLANFYNDNNRLVVESYRGGYLPNERRKIERGLREGTVHGVVSTNALELGIDIGGLDAAILAGFPGSISSSWQQAGRAGRRSSVSLAIMIASAAPMDQYMVKNPEYFFSRSPESGWIDPNNIYILTDHLKCAVFELPFREKSTFPEESTEVMNYLEEGGMVRYTGGNYYWSDRGYPAEGISLRSATAENIVIIDTTKGKATVIGEMDRPSAKELIFNNAVYIHRGNQYIVKELNIEERRCAVEATDVNYYTDAVVKKDIKVLHEDSTEYRAGARCTLGDILVRTQVAKFKKIKYQTHENIGYGEISLPSEEMHTRALCIILEPGTAAGEAITSVPEELKAAVIGRTGTLLKNVSPVFLLCDVRDIGVAERIRDPHFHEAVLYIYDVYPGGTGISEGFESNIDKIVAAALALVQNCDCAEGCPSCIGPKYGDEILTGNVKNSVSAFLSGWLGQNRG
jgi:DEAD/DEAH box helicase domain-containing protein